MSVYTYRAENSNVSLTFVGRLRFELVLLPQPSKNEWGMDVMEATWRGPVYLLRAFCKTLRQGAPYGQNAPGFTLQSYTVQPHAWAPTVNIIYKGLINGIPNPTWVNGVDEIVGTTTASGLNITTDAGVIVGGSMEVKYLAPITTYRYITNQEPTGRRFNQVRAGAIQLLDSRITAIYEDGSTREFPGSAPTALIGALAPVAENFGIGPIAQPVIGTPYWECEEVVQLRYRA